jgi:hypothetical protein
MLLMDINGGEIVFYRQRLSKVIRSTTNAGVFISIAF